MVPPHLPPPACDIERHRQIQRLKVLLVATFFGLLAGLTGASIILGWVWSGFGGGDTLINAQQSRLAWSPHQLEERVQKDISSRVVAVYSQEESLSGNNYFSPAHKLGEAVIISSDGWTAMYLPKVSINVKRARVLTADGAVYELEKTLLDSRSGLLFLKISLAKATDSQRAGGQFSVISLADEVNLADEVFVHERDSWRAGLINSEEWNIWPHPHLDTAPAYGYALNGSFSDGSVVINSQGRLAGLMVSDSLFLSATYLAHIMPTVLNAQKVVYTSLGVEGWYDLEQPIIVQAQRVPGSFAVSRVDRARSLLRVGDIITEINGQIVTPENLWYNISGEKTVRLKVWRSGKTVEIESAVSSL